MQKVSDVLISICHTHCMTYGHTHYCSGCHPCSGDTLGRPPRQDQFSQQREVPQKCAEQGLWEHTALPNNRGSLTHTLCLSAPSHFWTSKGNTIPCKPSNASVPRYHLHGFQPVSRAGALHPRELQRLACLDCYFKLLQLITSFSFQVAVRVFINQRCVQTLASWTL